MKLKIFLIILMLSFLSVAQYSVKAIHFDGNIKDTLYIKTNSIPDTTYRFINGQFVFAGTTNNSSFSPFNRINSLPTTLIGYGITDAYPLIGNPSNFLTTILGAQIITALGYTPYDGTVSLYSKSGLLSAQSKRFTDTFAVATATPTISLSSYLTTMACSNFKIVSATAYRVGATTSNSPNVTITAITSNSITLILNQINTSTVTILGINVLSGLPAVLVPDPTNVKVVLSFDAW